MRGSNYTEEQNAFIADHYMEMTYSELVKLYNEKFGADMNVSRLEKKVRYMGLPKKSQHFQSMFTPEIDAFLIENAFRFTSRDLAKEVRKKFGITPAKQTITMRLNDLGVHRGNTFVPEGYLPKSCKPIGSERIDKGRIVMVKVAQPNVWKPKVQVLTGYDPKESQAIFIDGNSLNVTPENIVVVSKKVHARLAKNGWLNSSNGVLMAGIKWSELYYALKEMEETL